MAKTTRLNVAVTANTRPFDQQMRKMSRRIRQVRADASGAAGGAFAAAGIGGGFGAGAGMALRGGPLLMALGALTAALESSRKTTEQGRADLSEAAALALSPSRQMEARIGSQLIKGEEGTAGDLVGARRGLQATLRDRRAVRRLQRDGFDVDALDDLAETVDFSDFTEKLIAFSKSISDGTREVLAEQLGGKAGEMLLRAAGVQRQGNISSAIDAAVSPQGIARSLSVRQQDEDAALSRQDPGVMTETLDLLTGQAAKTEQQQAAVIADMQQHPPFLTDVADVLTGQAAKTERQQAPSALTEVADLLAAQSAKTERQQAAVIAELQRQTAIMNNQQPAGI